jgi:hypothetical protein
MASAKKVHVVIDPRQSGRNPVMLAAAVWLPDGGVVEATIIELSPHGFRMRIAADLAEGVILRIELPVGTAPHARIVWVDGKTAGCAFLDPLAPEEVRLIADIWDGAAGPPML